MIWGFWSNGSVVKSTCAYRGPRLSSQCLYGGLYLSCLFLFQGFDATFWPPWACLHIVHLHTCEQNMHTYEKCEKWCFLLYLIAIATHSLFLFFILGVAPPSFVAIKAGTTLYQLTTAGEAVSWNSVFILMILALLSILPAIFQKKLKQKFE